jgi:hypothetical protein
VRQRTRSVGTLLKSNGAHLSASYGMRRNCTGLHNHSGVPLLIRCRGQSLVAVVVLISGLIAVEPACSTSATPLSERIVETAPASVFEVFLNRLMVAESGGRNDAKNPRSTALGPFQFIKSTFLEVTRRHFQAEIAGLTEEEILALRTNPELSRRAAAVYCKEIVRYLKEQGLEPTFAHLRLAYLLGPADAARIMQAQTDTPVALLLSPEIIIANPFLTDMSVADLIAKSDRDLIRDTNVPRHANGASSRPSPQAAPPCNPTLASCRKYVALAIARSNRAQARRTQGAASRLPSSLHNRMAPMSR